MGHPPIHSCTVPAQSSAHPCPSPRERAACLLPLLSFTSGLAGSSSPLKIFLLFPLATFVIGFKGREGRKKGEGGGGEGGRY